jgi:hypothetical protein
VGYAGGASSFGDPSQGTYGYSPIGSSPLHSSSSFVGQEYEKEEEPRESALCASFYCKPRILLPAQRREEIDRRFDFCVLSSSEQLYIALGALARLGVRLKEQMTTDFKEEF